MNRPPSARPSSARTTQTKTYFDRRDGNKDELEDPPSPFIANAVENDAFQSLLRNSGSDYYHEWDTLKTEKPRCDVEESIALTGINAIDRLVAGYFGKTSKGEFELDEATSILVSSDDVAQGFVKYFWCMFLGAIVRCVAAVKSIAGPKALNGKDGALFDSEEEGLFVPVKNPGRHHSKQTMTRIEERMRREIQIAGDRNANTEPNENSEHHTTQFKPDDGEGTSNSETSRCGDESFWASSGQIKMHGGNCKPIIEVTVNVEEIKLKQHPRFTEEESIMIQITNMYEMYSKYIEAGSIHYLIKRLIGLAEYLQSDGKDDTLSLRDLIATAEKLVAESNCIRDLHLQIEKLWKELLQARERCGFVGTDVELETEPMTDSEFDNNVQRLIELTLSLLASSFDSCLQENESSSLDKALNAVADLLKSDLRHCKQILVLAKTNNNDQLGRISKEEFIRRRKISSERYFARLFIDGHPVGDTRSVNLSWPSYSVQFSHTYNCKLTEQPEKSCIQIFMAPLGFLPAHLVCSIFVRIPRCNTGRGLKERIGSVPAIDWYEFSSGNGLKGAVLLSTSIAMTPSQTSGMVKVPHQMNSSKLLRLRPKQALLQGVPPRHENIAQVDESRSFYERQMMMSFKLDNIRIMSGTLQEPTRHILLRKRQSNPSVPSPIPISNAESEHRNDYSPFLKHDSEDVQEEIIESALRERRAVNKENAIRFFKTIMEHSLLKDSRRWGIGRKQYAEVIQDVSLFRFIHQDDFGITVIPRKRSLAPSTLQRLPLKKSLNKYSLLFSIVLGKNIPSRSQLNDNVSPDTFDDSEEVNVGLVVKVQLRGRSFYTRAVSASNTKIPFWNETLLVPLDFIGEDDNVSLILEEESVRVTVFDCVDTDVRNRGGFYDDEETRLLNYHYLASVKVPLSTVLRHGYVDGFVRCTSPDHIVGYSMKHSSSSIHNNNDDSEPRKMTQSPEAMLRIYATTDPIISIPTKSSSEHPSNECQTLLSRVDQWTEIYLADISCPVLWPDIHGVSYHASRFLVEQNPPRKIDTLEGCAHFVSLIPTRKSWRSLDKLNMDQNLVLSSQQTINILAGEFKEHAVLLANYFLYLSKRRATEFSADVYLVIGFSIPEGDVVWVMRKCKHSGDVVFWDATSGCSYAQESGSIPLLKIYCVVSNKNVFANLNRETKPHSLEFDFTNPRKWGPLHIVNGNGQTPIALTPIQGEVLQYSQPNHREARELQDDLKESIKSAMREWRRITTSFRTDVVSRLASILEREEGSKINGSEIDVASLEVVSRTRTVRGFSLHFPFTNIEDILYEIKETEIHLNKNPTVEFSLAVRVFAYPGGVMSVRVYVCSLVPK